MTRLDRQKFKLLAEKRVNRALRDIKLIGNLSNKRNYTYEEGDPEKIFRALKKGLDEMRARFNSEDDRATDSFTLD